MNRIITIDVQDETIRKSTNAAGAAGSYNAVTLELSFNSAWDGTTKTILFYDATGGNPVAIILTSGYLKPGETDVYLVPIPAEPLAYAGDMTLTIKGVVLDGETTERIICSASTTMKVAVSNAGTGIAAVQPTPTVAEQLQAEVDAINASSRNKNYLHNWDFRVNQRGVTGKTPGLQEYIADRWACGASSAATRNADGSISLTGGMSQDFESKNAELWPLLGKDVTCSVDIGGTIYSATLHPLELVNDSAEITTGVTVSLYSLHYQGAYLGSGFTITTTSETTIRRAKVEYGTVSTLQFDAYADRGEQLPLCQRWGVLTTCSLRATKVTANAIEFFVHSPDMILPTLQYYNGTVTVKTLAGTSQTGFTFNFYNYHNEIKITATKTSHGLTDAVLELADVFLRAIAAL